MGSKLYLFLVLYFAPLLLFAQSPIDKSHLNIDTAGKKDIIDVARGLFKAKPRPFSANEKKKVYFSFLPVSTAVPGGGAVLMTATTAGIYLGNPKDTYMSTFTFMPYYNFKARYGLPIRSSIWLNRNSWNIQGDTRIMDYPQYTWGLGGGQPESERLLVDYNYIRFYQSALKRVTSFFFAGIGYNFDYYLDIENSDLTAAGKKNTIAGFTGYPYGTSTDKNSSSSGISLNLLYDTRQNAFNPVPGAYVNLVYRDASEIFGGNTNWQSLYIDLRKYFSIGHSARKNMIALWTYYWTVLGTNAPYLELPTIGMDPYNRSGRGIEQNRYRGKRLIYFETEYRRDITKNGLLGFVLFANVDAAAQPRSDKFVYWNPAGGGGLRIKFNKKSGTNICLDYGISRYHSSVIIGLGEAF